MLTFFCSFFLQQQKNVPNISKTDENTQGKSKIDEKCEKLGKSENPEKNDVNLEKHRQINGTIRAGTSENRQANHKTMKNVKNVKK